MSYCAVVRLGKSVSIQASPVPATNTPRPITHLTHAMLLRGSLLNTSQPMNVCHVLCGDFSSRIVLLLLHITALHKAVCWLSYTFTIGVLTGDV
jgi:hypothetical protein